MNEVGSREKAEPTISVLRALEPTGQRPRLHDQLAPMFFTNRYLAASSTAQGTGSANDRFGARKSGPSPRISLAILIKNL